ncbi:hypothetical protein OROHE_023172 [Orobanche hederae]
MCTMKCLKNTRKALLKPFDLLFRNSIMFTSANPLKSQRSTLYHENPRCFRSTPNILQNLTFYGGKGSNFSHVPSCATGVRENVGKEPKPDDRTTREAETICKLISKVGDSRNLDPALDSANLSDRLSPGLVLEVLKKLNNAGSLALSFFRWAEKRKEFQHTSECYNALIESLGKIKQFKMVWLLVDEMKLKDLLGKDAFAVVCRRYARAKKVEEAIEAFMKMEKKYGLKPDLRDYNRLLDTLSKSGHVEKAQEVFDKWKNTMFTPDIKSYTILLEGWGKECNFLRLDEVCREMREDGFEPDVVCYGILIKTHCRAKRYNEAVEFYDEMERKNIKATFHIYCTLINAFGAENRLDYAIKFFELCKSSIDCVIEAPTYNALVGAYCRSTRTDDAYKVVDEMRQCGVGPNARTYDIILRHLIKVGKTKEAYSCFEKMNEEPGCEPTYSTYEIMVRMFRNEGNNMDMALRVWDRMKAKGVLPTMQMFSVLIDGLCYDNKLEDACKYFLEMLDMGIRPPGRVFTQLKKRLLNERKEDVVGKLAHRIENVTETLMVG